MRLGRGIIKNEIEYEFIFEHLFFLSIARPLITSFRSFRSFASSILEILSNSLVPRDSLHATRNSFYHWDNMSIVSTKQGTICLTKRSTRLTTSLIYFTIFAIISILLISVSFLQSKVIERVSPTPKNSSEIFPNIIKVYSRSPSPPYYSSSTI